MIQLSFPYPFVFFTFILQLIYHKSLERSKVTFTKAF